MLVSFTLELENSKLLPNGGSAGSNYMLLSHYGKWIFFNFFFNGEHIHRLVTTVQAFLVLFRTMLTFIILISASTLLKYSVCVCSISAIPLNAPRKSSHTQLWEDITRSIILINPAEPTPCWALLNCEEEG